MFQICEQIEIAGIPMVAMWGPKSVAHIINMTPTMIRQTKFYNQNHYQLSSPTFQELLIHRLNHLRLH